MVARKKSRSLLSSSAVLLIDMQPGFLGKMSKKKTQLVSYQVGFIRECARLDIPVIVLEFAGQGDTLPELMDEVRLVPRNRQMTKLRDDGFMGTCLDRVLRELGVKKLVFMGVNASFCVRKTAESAMELGYEIITGDHLIANVNKCRCLPCLSKSRDWYLANGVFCEEPLGLKAMLSRRAKAPKQV